MKALVLDLLDSYEQRVSSVEKIIAGAYETAADFDKHVNQACNTREKLLEGLRQTLAQNCSLRRKDFDTLTRGVFSEMDARQTEIEELENLVRERLKTYLSKQKEMVSALRHSLNGISQEESVGGLQEALSGIRNNYEADSEQTFVLLRDFQRELDDFRRDQEVLNNKLQRMVERGKELRLEDLRVVGEARAREQRRTDRELRRDDVERLLAHFRQHRLEAVPAGK